MIEAPGTVVAAQGGRVWIETDPQPACGQCAGHCTAAIAARALGRSRRFQVASRLPLRAGDAVILGIAEQALLRGSLQIYLWPLLLFLLGAVLGNAVGGESAAVGSSAVGLGLGLLYARTAARQMNDALQPVVRRRVAADVAAACRDGSRLTGA